MRILVQSAAPWVLTGYGLQTRQLVEHLVEDGHEVYCVAQGGSNVVGSMMDWQGIPVFPSRHEPWGTEVTPIYYEMIKADLLITLFDARTYDRPAYSKMRWLAWAPVDHSPMSLKDAAAMTRAWLPVAYSEFGLEKMKEIGLAGAIYIPHGIDPEVFKPADKAESREWLGLPQDAFIYGMVAANHSFRDRKQFSKVMEAFANISKDHDDVVLYLHTATNSPRGLNLDILGRQLEMPKDRWFMANQPTLFAGLKTEDMARVYSAFDVLCSPSMGEGFGLPILEAQCCEVPVIVTDFSAMPEHCFYGLKVPVHEYTYTLGHSWQAWPFRRDIENAMRDIYDAGISSQMAKNARKAAILKYDADTVYERYWKPTLRKAEEWIKEDQWETDKDWITSGDSFEDSEAPKT